MKNLLILLILTLFVTTHSYSQGEISSPMPNIELYSPSAGYHSVNSYTFTLGCGVDNARIRATYTEVGSTESYRVESIPFRPKPYARDRNFDGVIDSNDFDHGGGGNSQGDVLSTLGDDRWSNPFNLRTQNDDLTFCFFGNQRNQFVLSSNGIVSFDTSYAGAYSAWDIQNMGKIAPNANLGDNRESIILMTDTDPTDPAALSDTFAFWNILGPISQRYFIMGYHRMPLYSSASGCGNTFGYATYQMVFYETTNIIEYHIQDKPICLSWPGSQYVAMGIQNYDLDVGFTAPGRDNLDHFQILDLTDGFYDANFNSAFPINAPEGWRYIPDGNMGVAPVFTWYENYNHGTQTGTPFGANPNDVNLSVSAADLIALGVTSVVYTAEVAYTDPCDGTVLKFARDVTFQLDDPLLMHIKELNSVDDTIEVYDVEDLTLCIGDNYDLEALVQNFTGADLSTIDFQWQVDQFPNPAVLLGTNPIEQIINAQPGTYVYTVTIRHFDALGALICQFDDSINVTVTDTITFEYPAPKVFCASDTDISPINISPAGGIYTISNGGVWVNPEANPLESLDGIIDLSESMNTAVGGNIDGTGVFVITYTVGTCASNTAQDTITINSAPNIVIPVNNLIECETNSSLHTATFDMAAIELELLNGETGLTLVWQNNVASGPVPPNPMTATFNTTNITLKVTATDPTDPAGCTSEVIFDLVVNTAPVITNQNENLCSGTALNIDLDSYATLAGNSYSWLATDNPNVTGETTTTTTTTLITDTLINTSNSLQNVIYTVTPTGTNSCAGNSFTVTIALAPTLTISNQTDSTCSNSTINVDLNSYTTQAGVTYSWVAADNPNATGETTTATTTTNITDTLINTSTTTQDVIYTVTPSVNGCTAADFTVTVSIGNPSFDFTTATYCSDGLDPIPTNVFPAVGTAGAGFFTISNGGVWLNPQANPLESLDGIIDLSESMNTVVGGNADGTGNFRITYTTTIGTIPNQSFCSSFFDISISTIETNFTYANSYCISGSNPIPTSIGSAGGIFSILPSGTVLDTTTGEIDITSLTVGTTYTVTYTKGGTCPSSTDITFDVTAAADASFTYPVICLSNTTSLLPNSITTGGGVFSITLTNGNTGGTIDAVTGDLAGNTAGTYKVEYTTTGCVGSSEIDITINPAENAIFSFANTAYCAGAGNITPTLDANISTGIFTIGSVTLPPTSLPINATTGEITVDATVTTSITYNVIYTTTGPCPTSSTQQVTINPEDNAAFTYPSASVCIADNTATPNSISTNGGTFTILKSNGTAGGSINSSSGIVDLTTSGVGDYIITYDTTSVGNPCPNNITFALTITAQDNTNFGYNGTDFTQTHFCVGDLPAIPNPLPSTFGGTYTINNGGAIDVITGEIDFGATAATNTPYTIQYITAGSCSNTSTTTIVVHSDETATFNYDLFYCSNGTVNPTPTNTGTGGGLYEVTNGGLFVDSTTSTDSISGEFDLAASGLGTDLSGIFVIKYQTQGVYCQDSAEYTITINSSPEITTPTSEIVCGSFTLPVIAGTNLTGNQRYYTQSNGQGDVFAEGFIFDETTPVIYPSVTYPVTLYIYDQTGSITTQLCKDEETFTLNVIPTPIYTMPNDITQCEDPDLNIHTSGFDTTSWNATILGTQIDPKYSVIYSAITVDPNTGIETAYALPDPLPTTLNAPSITIRATVRYTIDASTNTWCESIPLAVPNDNSFRLIVREIPIAIIPTDVGYTTGNETINACEDDTNPDPNIHTANFDTSNWRNIIFDIPTNTDNPNYEIEYTYNDGTVNITTTNIPNPLVVSSQTITFIVRNISTGAGIPACDSQIQQFKLQVNLLPIYTMPNDITQCEDPDLNIHTSGFDTTSWNATILGTQIDPKYSVIYSAVTVDPNTGIETAYALPDPLPTTLNAPSITIRATVRYTIDASTNTWCESIPLAVPNDNSFRLIVREIPIAIIPTDVGYTTGNETINACEDDTNPDPNIHTANFDTSNWRNIIFDIPTNTDNPNYEIEYTYNDGTVNITTTNIPNPLVVSSQTITFIVRNISTGAGIPVCDSQIQQFKLQVNLLPIGTNTTAEICSGEEVHLFDTDNNVIPLDLDNFATFIDEGDGVNRNTYKWHAIANPNVTGETTTEVITDATNTTITDVLTNSGTTAQFVIYEVTPISVGGCEGEVFTVTVEVGFAPDITDQTESSCNNEQLSIDLDSYTTLTGNTYTWKAKTDYIDIEGESLTEQTSTTINDILINNSSSNIFVEYEVTPSSSAQCKGNTFTVIVEVYPIPQFNLNDQYFICPDAQIDTTIGEIDNPSGYTYEWFVATDMLTAINNNADSRLLDVNEMDITATGGIYALTATDSNGCSQTLLTSVSLAEQFEITNVYVDDFNGQNNTITIEVTGGSGAFEYTLTDEDNNSITQVGNPIFENLTANTYQIEVTDVTGCSKFRIQDNIYVLDYPPFFTPNGDLNHDTWQIKGANLIPDSKIYIYDRYGKLIAQVDPTSVVGWDGLYNGKQMPASDYWFTADYIDPNNLQPKTVKGHFSIVRR